MKLFQYNATYCCTIVTRARLPPPFPPPHSAFQSPSIPRTCRGAENCFTEGLKEYISSPSTPAPLALSAPAAGAPVAVLPLPVPPSTMPPSGEGWGTPGERDETSPLLRDAASLARIPPALRACCLRLLYHIIRRERGGGEDDAVRRSCKQTIIPKSASR